MVAFGADVAGMARSAGALRAAHAAAARRRHAAATVAAVDRAHTASPG